MIAKRFGFTRNFLRERNTGLYCRLKKILCGFKDRARACLLMDFPGSRQIAGAYLVSVHKRASLPVMDSLRKNVVLLRSHFQ
jgi:hypothetical protein